MWQSFKMWRDVIVFNAGTGDSRLVSYVYLFLFLRIVTVYTHLE